MAKPLKDAGMIQLLLTRLNEERLPQALRLKDKVERGECLSDYELGFMKSVIDDTTQARRIAARYPEYENLIDRVAALYSHIAERAAENEQAHSGHLL
jgi:hypothetical protein